jgi:hypothetical protein
VSSPQSFVAVAQIAQSLAQCCDLINGSGSWSQGVGLLWNRLTPLPRLTWCNAALLSSDCSLRFWSDLDPRARSRLIVALENMLDFFREVGA